jgi:hypothetical protein
MPGKRVSVADILSQGRARTAGAEPPASAPAGSTAASERQDVETSKYKRVTVYLTDEQHRWAKTAARAAGDESLSASDVIRLAVARLEPVRWSGTFRAPDGRRYRVEACEGHRPPTASTVKEAGG